MATKVLAQIEASKIRPFARLLFGLGIRHVGATVAEALATHFATLEALMVAEVEALSELDGVGPRIAASCQAFFALPENRRVIARLQAAGVSFALSEAERSSTLPQSLAGLTFVLTGALTEYTREAAAAALKALGAKTTSSVSKRTSFVIAGADAGSKYNKALALGVPVLEEADLREILALSDLPDRLKGRSGE
jgi:DNA ligase (NAD+)